MRTTIDLEPAVLERAKRLAQAEGRTLGSVLNEALVAYLGRRKSAAKEAPFELLVRGNSRGRFPSPAEVNAVEEEEELEALGVLVGKRRASP